MKVYLAGKMLPEVRKKFYELTEDLRDGERLVIPDLRSKDVSSVGYIVSADVFAIDCSDAVIVFDVADFMMKGTMAEVGYAFANGIPIFTFVSGSFIHPVLAYMSSIVTLNLETLVKYLRTYIETNNLLAAYYGIYQD